MSVVETGDLQTCFSYNIRLSSQCYRGRQMILCLSCCTLEPLKPLQVETHPKTHSHGPTRLWFCNQHGANLSRCCDSRSKRDGSGPEASTDWLGLFCLSPEEIPCMSFRPGVEPHMAFEDLAHLLRLIGSAMACDLAVRNVSVWALSASTRCPTHQQIYWFRGSK